MFGIIYYRLFSICYQVFYFYFAPFLCTFLVIISNEAQLDVNEAFKKK